MDLVAYESSSLVVLLSIKRPAGQLYLPAAAAMLVSRYAFADPPEAKNLLNRDANSIEFRHGRFDGSAIDLALYNDGVLISSSSNTDLHDAFFADLSEWMGTELGVEPIKTQKIDKMYASNILISSKKDILSPLSEIQKIGASVSRRLAKTNELKVNFEPFGVTLAADATLIPGMKPEAFRVERKAGINFDLSQYSSSAPLRTKDHLAVLDELEALV